MARPSRIDIFGYHYHVISRGQRKNPIFFSPADRAKYFSIVNKLLNETDIEIYAYCLMTNHVHMDIYRNEYPLQIFMKRLNTKYALYFNKKYNLVGHVFQGRYISKVVLDNYYLVSLIKYIHMNPVEAGIVETPGEYKYSSARFYEDKQEENIPNIEKIPIFKDTERYIEFMESEDMEYPIYRDSIGSKDDYVSLEKRMSGRDKSKFKEKRLSKRDIYTDAQKIAEGLGYEIEKVLTYKWDRDKNKKDIRIQIIKELVKYGYNHSEIAHFFGYDNSAISKILKEEL